MKLSFIPLFARAALALAVSLGPGAHSARAADPIRIGTVQSQGGASVFVAAAKGYFAAEGLDAKVVTFNAAAPIAVAAAAGDLDFATTALTAAFCNLAYQGTLKIIASGTWERVGFQTIGFLVSNQAYAAGLKSFKDLKGHSVAITQRGTPLEFDLARILTKYGLAQSDIRVLPLQSNQNIASALKGGEVDVGVQTVANIYPLVTRGDAKLLGWVADELGAGQSTVTFTTGKIAKEHPDIVRRFLAAYAKGAQAWDAGFLDASGQRKDQPEAGGLIDIVAKALDQPRDIVARGIAYFDPQNRIVLSNLQDVLDWYLANDMLKTHMDAKALIDERFVVYAH